MEHVPVLRVVRKLQVQGGLEYLNRGQTSLRKSAVLSSARSLETTASSVTSMRVPQLANAAHYFGVRSRVPVLSKKAPRSRSIVLNNRRIPENLLLDRLV